jgi:hypothetical protein
VTFTTGGAPDILARLIGEKLQTSWGQPVIIDNKPGAGGNTGADSVAKSPPDGHTIVVGTVGTHSINGALYTKMPYDMVKDFTPITLLATTPNMLVVHNDVPAKNLKEFIDLGKKAGKMTFASSGSGTSIHVSGELFKTMTGIDMEHIPYKGRATAIPDLLGGRVTMMFDNMPSSLQLVREGKLRALGVTSAQRSPAAPEIPTIAEQGLPGSRRCRGSRCSRRPAHRSRSSTSCRPRSRRSWPRRMSASAWPSPASTRSARPPTSSRRTNAPRSRSGRRSSRTRAQRSSDARPRPPWSDLRRLTRTRTPTGDTVLDTISKLIAGTACAVALALAPAAGAADVAPGLASSLSAYYDFEHPDAGNAALELDQGLSGTTLMLVNGGAAMRTADGAWWGSQTSIQTQQLNGAPNDDWKAGVYAGPGVPTLAVVRVDRRRHDHGLGQADRHQPEPQHQHREPERFLQRGRPDGRAVGQFERARRARAARDHRRVGHAAAGRARPPGRRRVIADVRGQHRLARAAADEPVDPHRRDVRLRQRPDGALPERCRARRLVHVGSRRLERDRRRPSPT